MSQTGSDSELAPHETTAQHQPYQQPEHVLEGDIEINVVTPSASAPDPVAAGNADYFTLEPAAASHTSLPLDSSARPPHPSTAAKILPLHSAVSASPTASASDAIASGHVEPPDVLSSPYLATRPAPHTTPSSLSVQSSNSTTTITRETAGLSRHPVFPVQNFAALHTQFYPPPHMPPALRYRTSQPYGISTFASAIASQHSNGVRTVHNSPAVTPSLGLFSPHGPPSAPATEGSEGSAAGTYASPFLHYTQYAVPKETHVADVDVDPISGRKLINHYEIIDELGRGTHGKVKLGRDLTSPKDQPIYVAIKIVERFSKRRKLGRLGTTEDKVKKEVAILKKARHPNAVALLEVIDDPTRKKVYIVLEWVERGEINWRVKGPKEIGMIEARRYEREKAGNLSERALAEDAAVLIEAQKRLAREKRRQLKAYRLLKKGLQDAPGAWSNEMSGDTTESEESEEDRLSRISSHTTYSNTGNLAVDAAAARPSRTPSPLPPSLDSYHYSEEHFIPLTPEPERSALKKAPRQLPRRSSSAMSITGLEGTMYGSYDYPSQTSRIASSNSLTSSRAGSEGLGHVATEILDSHLDPELEYVPVMTMDQIRVAFRDTLLGLQYLHYQGIVHRDIKPPNLLATFDNRVKISDFGVSYLGRPVRDGEAGEDVSEAEAQDLDDEAKELAKTVGTPAFYAPELCNTDATDDPLPVTKAIDVWALGVTLFCMLFARTPFVDNEYIVMRQICDEEIYLPRKRLQPVDNKPKSRPSSHNRAYPPMAMGRRHELDVVYEEINDELHDLLKRLLIKDPRKRITLEEVRHHPWVLSDLTNKFKWLEETDPSRQAEGKKIEVSKEDVSTAVVPLNLVERMRSGLKKVFEKTGITRTRGQSVSGKDSSPTSLSAASSSSTISSDARRRSFRGDESIYSALKASRENGHPLTSSLAASPEVEIRDRFSDNATTLSNDELAANTFRPNPPQRAMTISSAAGSMRTVTQSNYHATNLAPTSESPPPSPGLPGTPRDLASPNGSQLGGPFGGIGRLARTIRRERSTQLLRRRRGISRDRASVESLDSHAEASLAVSHATAAGHVTSPDSLQNPAPLSSAHESPASSRSHSRIDDHNKQHLQPAQPDSGPISRKSSTSSLASFGRSLGEALWSKSRQSHRAPESSAEDWKRANEERVRKLVREEETAQTSQRSSPRPTPTSTTNTFDPHGYFENRSCPDSPDDLLRGKQPPEESSRVPSVADISNPDTTLDSSASPSGGHHHSQLPPAMVSSSSDLGSARSMSISNPSIPSVISKASSVDPRDGFYSMYEDKPNPEDEAFEIAASRYLAKEQSAEAVAAADDDDDNDDDNDEACGPEQDTGLESRQEYDDDDDDDEFDDSSDSDGGLVMRRKSVAKQQYQPHRQHRQHQHHQGAAHGSLKPAPSVSPPLSPHTKPIGQQPPQQQPSNSLLHQKERRLTGLSARSKKSSRSGSNNTMKKVPVVGGTLDCAEDESRRSLETETEETEAEAEAESRVEMEIGEE